MKSQICSFCCVLFYQVLLAQATFLEKAKEVGIDHYFYNENLMGGGVAVFDFDQDGWEDIWINGCLLYTSDAADE